MSPLGSQQTNNLLHITVDIWQDKVFFNEREYPAGYFAMSVMNITLEELGALQVKGGAVWNYSERLAKANREQTKYALPELRIALLSLLDDIWRFPPFSLMDMQAERHAIDVMLSDASLGDITREGSPGREFFLSYVNGMARIPWGIYHYIAAAWTFELDYLRRLGKRRETYFAVAAHDCFNSRDFWKEMKEYDPLSMESFSVKPQLKSSFVFARSPKDEKEMVFVNRVSFDKYVDFYTFDLFNGLHHGHAPCKCANCGRYFLTTTGHMPKYCDGVSPQDPALTCRQIGAQARQKEKNKNHPIYALYSTRTNTIRKHHERGKITGELREAALYTAESCREKALFDNEYAANGYAGDMELDSLYAAAKQRLKK